MLYDLKTCGSRSLRIRFRSVGRADWLAADGSGRSGAAWQWHGLPFIGILEFLSHLGSNRITVAHRYLYFAPQQDVRFFKMIARTSTASRFRPGN